MPPIRTALFQPLLPAYRVPVFTRLAAQPGIDLTLFVGQPARGSSLGDVPAPPGLKVEAAPRHAWRDRLFFQPQALWAALGDRFDVLVLPWVTREVHLLPTLALARARGLGTVVWGHGYSKAESARRRQARNAMGRLAHATLFYARRAADRCVAEGFDAARVFVASNALDQAPIAAARAAWPAARVAAFAAEQGWVPASAGGGTLIFISRLEADKRVDLLLHALRHLRDRRPHVRLVVIGDGAERATLEALAAQLGVAEAVSWVGALYGEAALAPYCLAADLFAYPAAIGLSILHAFGYGLPVLTSDDLAAHNPEIETLVPGLNGAVYRDGDAAAFAAAADTLLDDDLGRARMSRAALATVQPPAGYTVDRMVEGFVAAIEMAQRLRTAGGVPPEGT